MKRFSAMAMIPVYFHIEADSMEAAEQMSEDDKADFAFAQVGKYPAVDLRHANFADAVVIDEEDSDFEEEQTEVHGAACDGQCGEPGGCLINIEEADEGVLTIGKDEVQS